MHNTLIVQVDMWKLMMYRSWNGNSIPDRTRQIRSLSGCGQIDIGFVLANFFYRWSEKGPNQQLNRWPDQAEIHDYFVSLFKKQIRSIKLIKLELIGVTRENIVKQKSLYFKYRCKKVPEFLSDRAKILGFPLFLSEQLL